MRPSWRLAGVETALRRLMHVYWRLSRGSTVQVRAVLLDAHDGVWLTPSRAGSGPPRWELPGRGVKAGETVYQAIAEALARQGPGSWQGSLAGPSTLRLHGMHSAPPRGAEWDYTVLFSAAASQAATPKDAGRAKGTFFPLEALPPNLEPEAREQIALVLARLREKRTKRNC